MRNTEAMKTGPCDSYTSLLICQNLESPRRWTSEYAWEGVSGLGWSLTMGGIILWAGAVNCIERAKGTEYQHALLPASWL